MPREMDEELRDEAAAAIEGGVTNILQDAYIMYHEFLNSMVKVSFFSLESIHCAKLLVQNALKEGYRSHGELGEREEDIIRAFIALCDARLNEKE